MSKPYMGEVQENGDVVATIPPGNWLQSLVFSYSATPSTGGIKIESPAGTEIFAIGAYATGPQTLPLTGDGIHGAAGANVVVTLLAGGAGITGMLNVLVRHVASG